MPVTTTWSIHSFAPAPLPGRIPIVVPPAFLRPARRGGHHVAQPSRDHRAAALGEQAADLLGALPRAPPRCR